jgi:hypothetical protein
MSDCEWERGLLEWYESGDKVLLGSYAGGADPRGAWSTLSLVFRSADGTEEIRWYTELIEKGDAAMTTTPEMIESMRKLITWAETLRRAYNTSEAGPLAQDIAEAKAILTNVQVTK